jgi:type IV pilus assembly protein PilB
MLLLDLLVSQNTITKDDATEIVANLAGSKDTLVDDQLIAKKVGEAQILQIRSVLYGIPVYTGTVARDPVLNKLITIAQTKQLAAIPLELKDEVLYVGIVDPDHANVIDALQFMFGSSHRAYKVFLITYTQFKEYVTGKKLVEGKDGEKTETQVEAPLEEEKPKSKAETGETVEEIVDLTNVSGGLGAEVESFSIPDIFNTILRHGIDISASDIHIEHMGTKMRARFRVDGKLETEVTLSSSMHQTLVARIKILSGLKLDEKRKPQDGRFSTKLDTHKIDYRVSSFPGYYGEKIVIRILDSYRGVRALDSIGLLPFHLEEIRKALAKPYGIILISGPTGSGKTTTLYAMLGEVDKEHRNVVSLEDPIEYNIPSINQSQVFPEIGYTFASGLRSILRQDPDVILVGEIRDAETASLAIQAALTGHLVLSTIHTNTSVGVITRLLDMGIEPYLITSTLNLAIGQRLVRSIAEGCAKPMVLDEGMKMMIEKQFSDLDPEYKKRFDLTLPPNEPVPSKDVPTGMKGRLSVFETLPIDEDIQHAIIEAKQEDQIWALARKKGMITMKEDALIKSMQGKVPFVEVNSL